VASPTLAGATSGDAALDRRLDWARAYAEDGDHAAAAGMLADLVIEAPHFAAAWFLLGETLEAAGDLEGAAGAFREARDRAPEDAMGAGLRLARLGGAPAEGAMSAAYVRTLFDQYAGRFDTALRTRLAYRGPELLAAALDAACAAMGRPLAFVRALDLGCGTGLAAPLLAPFVARLEGVDLSPAMLAQAGRLGLYADLRAAEMGADLRAAPAGAYDLIVAADALCYVAELGPLLAAARRALAPSGLLAVTLETHEGEGVILRDTLRYAHARGHLAAAAAAAGLSIVSLDAASTRTEKGAPVPGLVAVLGG
jgi:predicted TPR repeat methyltransferase